MRLTSRFASTFNIRPAESRLVNLLLLHSFFVGICRVFLLSASTSLFLTEFGANTLPYVYIATALVNSSVGLIYTWLGKKISFVKLLIVNLTFQGVLVSIFWILFGLTDAQWPAIGFMISIELLWLLTNLEFWSLSARVFNIQQGKRLFGIVGAGDTIASIIGGFAIPIIVTWIGTRNLLIVVVASIIASLATVWVIARSFGEHLSGEQASPENADGTQPYINPLKTPYIVLIFLFACVATISYYFLDNAFYALTEIHYPESESLAGFLGIYFALVALIQLVVQTGFNARIINRLGITVCIIIVPLLGTVMLAATTLTGLLAGAASITFILMSATRLVEYVLRGTLTSSSQMTIYQSLPSSVRLQTQAEVESLIEPVTTGLTGILLLFFLDVLKWNFSHLVFIATLVGLVWTVIAIFLSRQYPKALLQALSKRRLGQTQPDGNDYSIVSLLKTSLVDRSASDVLYLINLASSADPSALQRVLPNLLKHPAVEVRLDVLSWIEKFKLAGARTEMRQLLETETHLDVRATAIRVASGIDPDFMSNQTVHYLASDAVPIQIAAIRGAVQGGIPKAVAMAEANLQQLLISKSPRIRILAIEAVGEMGIQNRVADILPLLRDDNMDVRRAAIQCAGKLQSPQLWPLVIENLSVDAMRPTAISVLSKGDATLRPLLAAQLTEIRSGFESRVNKQRAHAAYLIRIASRLNDTALLEPHIDFPDLYIRAQILTALVKMKSQLNPEKIESQIRAEIQADFLFVQGLIFLKGDTLLCDVLSYLLDRLRERIFLLCALAYDPTAIERIHIDYDSDSEAKQSYALEMLHVTLSHELRPLIVALLDKDLDYHQGLDTLAVLFEQTEMDRNQWLERVLTSSTSPSWLKVIVLYGIRSRGETSASQAVQIAAKDTNAIVRETALWVLENSHETDQTRRKMLPTIEKMLLLKSVSLFSRFPDPILFEIASIVKDEHVLDGKAIIQKDDIGDCMYIIASGSVRIHDGAQIITQLGEKDVFGELALLDSEPRNASVTAVEETHLLRLDQNTFYELISDYPEVLRGIIRILSQRLRETTLRSTQQSTSVIE